MAQHRGRPPLDRNDTTVQVSISLPSKQFDALCKRAREQDQSLPEVMRRLIYGNAYTLIKPSKK